MGKAESESLISVTDVVRHQKALSAIVLNNIFRSQGLAPYKETLKPDFPGRSAKSSLSDIIELINEDRSKGSKYSGAKEPLILPTAFRIPAKHTKIHDLERASLIGELCNLPGRPFTTIEVHELLKAKTKEIKTVFENIIDASEADFAGEALTNYDFRKGISNSDIPDETEIAFKLVQQGIILTNKGSENFIHQVQVATNEIVSGRGYNYEGLQGQYFFFSLQNWGPVAKGIEPWNAGGTVRKAFRNYVYQTAIKSGRAEQEIIETCKKSFNQFLIETDIAFLGSLQARVAAYANNKKIKTNIDFQIPKLAAPEQIPVYAFLDKEEALNNE